MEDEKLKEMSFEMMIQVAKMLFLVNGGGAIATLALMGQMNAVTNSSAGSSLAFPAFLFSVGAITVIISAALLFFGLTPDEQQKNRTILDPLLNILIIVSFVVPIIAIILSFIILV